MNNEQYNMLTNNTIYAYEQLYIIVYIFVNNYFVGKLLLLSFLFAYYYLVNTYLCLLSTFMGIKDQYNTIQCF